MTERFLRSVIKSEFIKTAMIPLLLVVVGFLLLHFSIITAAGGRVLFVYIAVACTAFFLFVAARARTLAKGIAGPLEELQTAATKMSEKNCDGEVRPAGISEIDGLRRCIDTISASFRKEVAKQKKRIVELEQNAAKFQKYVESYDAVPWEAGSSMLKMEDVGPRIQSLLGHSPEQWQKPGFWKECILPEDRVRVSGTFAARIADGRDFDIEYRMITSTGRIVWVHNVVTVEKGESERIRGFFFDVTERRRDREALTEKDQLREQSQKMEVIGRLTDGVAHDFNNMLTVMKGYTDPGMLKTENVGGPALRYMGEIRKAAERVAGLTRRMMAFSRNEPARSGIISVNDTISGMRDILDHIIGEDVELVLSLAGDLFDVEVDPNQIEQIVINLVVNAVDAMPSGGKLTIETASGKLEESCKVEGLDPGRFVTLAVADTGCGMSRELLDHVTHPLFSSKEQGRTSVLGLSNVFGIVDRIKGRVEVDSLEGIGTRFLIRLPRCLKEGERETDPSPEGADDRSGSETVLLVEDDDILRSLAQRILEVNGYSVLSAEDGLQALDLFERNSRSIDLIVTDAVMPNLSGGELTRKAGLIRPDIRVLFISGYPVEILAEKGILDSTFNLLSKPFTPTQLLTKVRDVLAGPAPSPDAPISQEAE